MKDIVEDILHRVGTEFAAVLACNHGAAANDEAFYKALMQKVEESVRLDWGGERAYICKTGESASLRLIRRDIEVRKLHRAGNSANVIGKRMGITPTRVRQILAA